jgi:hypothetical protein
MFHPLVSLVCLTRIARAIIDSETPKAGLIHSDKSNGAPHAS